MARPLRLLVSILVLVDVALEHTVYDILLAESPLFQSLFSWMSLLNLVAEAILPAIKGRFNPCSRGCRS